MKSTKKMMVCPAASACTLSHCAHWKPHEEMYTCEQMCTSSSVVCVPQVKEEKPKKTTKKFLITVTVEEVA